MREIDEIYRDWEELTGSKCIDTDNVGNNV